MYKNIVFLLFIASTAVAGPYKVQINSNTANLYFNSNEDEVVVRNRLLHYSDDIVFMDAQPKSITQVPATKKLHFTNNKTIVDVEVNNYSFGEISNTLTYTPVDEESKVSYPLMHINDIKISSGKDGGFKARFASSNNNKYTYSIGNGAQIKNLYVFNDNNITLYSKVTNLSGVDWDNTNITSNNNIHRQERMLTLPVSEKSFSASGFSAQAREYSESMVQNVGKITLREGETETITKNITLEQRILGTELTQYSKSIFLKILPAENIYQGRFRVFSGDNEVFAGNMPESKLGLWRSISLGDDSSIEAKTKNIDSIKDISSALSGSSLTIRVTYEYGISSEVSGDTSDVYLRIPKRQPKYGNLISSRTIANCDISDFDLELCKLKNNTPKHIVSEVREIIISRNSPNNSNTLWSLIRKWRPNSSFQPVFGEDVNYIQNLITKLRR